MTLEEAKKRITDCVKLCADDYNRYEDEFMRGEAAAYKNALAILNGIDTEPVGNPDTLTLTELAHELRRLFRFKWLTVERTGYITLWKVRPKYFESEDEICKTWGRGDDQIGGMCVYIFPKATIRNLDLSEYAYESGDIDYSRCIVEVSDDAE